MWCKNKKYFHWSFAKLAHVEHGWSEWICMVCSRRVKGKSSQLKKKLKSFQQLIHAIHYRNQQSSHFSSTVESYPSLLGFELPEIDGSPVDETCRIFDTGSNISPTTTRPATAKVRRRTINQTLLSLGKPSTVKSNQHLYILFGIKVF